MNTVPIDVTQCVTRWLRTVCTRVHVLGHNLLRKVSDRAVTNAIDIAAVTLQAVGSGSPQAVQVHSARLDVQTAPPSALVDITAPLDAFVHEHELADGLLHLFCRHTTAGLLVNENETGFREDLTAILEGLAPRDRYWAHDDLTRRWENLVSDERPNGHSHVQAGLVAQSSLSVPVAAGGSMLGRWQRIFLIDLDGGQTRTVVAQLWGTCSGAGHAHHTAEGELAA